MDVGNALVVAAGGVAVGMVVPCTADAMVVRLQQPHIIRSPPNIPDAKVRPQRSPEIRKMHASFFPVSWCRFIPASGATKKRPRVRPRRLFSAYLPPYRVKGSRTQPLTRQGIRQVSLEKTTVVDRWCAYSFANLIFAMTYRNRSMSLKTEFRIVLLAFVLGLVFFRPVAQVLDGIYSFIQNLI